MARITKTVGTGITAEERVSYTDEDMFPAFVKWMQQWNSARKEAGGDFGAAFMRLIKYSRWILDGDGPDGPDSQKYFARRIVDAYEAALACLERGDGENAARCAFDMGYLYSQAMMKAKWESAALTGRKVRHEEAGANRGGRKKGETVARDVALAREYQQRRPTARMSDTALKQQIGAAQGLGRSAAVEAINRGLKKLSG